MYELFYVTGTRGGRGREKFYIFDTYTFLLREYSAREVLGAFYQGYQINGLSLNGDDIVWRHTEKSLIYSDGNFAFIRSSVPESDDFYVLEVVPLRGNAPCFSFKYYTWITKNLDFVDVSVSRGTGNLSSLYEVKFFGNKVGYSLLLANVGGLLCTVYKDEGYVDKSNKLVVTSSPAGVIAYRENNVR